MSCMDVPSGSLAGLAERAMAAHVPLHVQLEVTGRCHMDCVHCYLDIKNPPKNELSTDEVIRVLDELAAAGAMFLNITGGEIFLRKDLFTIIEAARERRFAIKLFTSGTLLDRERVARVAALKPVAVEISIYGMSSAVHDTVTRRPRSLRKSLRAAVLLRQAGVPVVIKSPMLSGTDGSHFDLIDAARRIGAGYKIDPSLVSRRDGGAEPLDARASRESLVELFGDRRLVADPSGPLPPPRDRDEAPCAIGRRVVRIGPDGDVFACNVFPIPVGNVRASAFADIWRHSPVLEEIRSFNNRDLEGECSGCSRQGYCGRCSAQALLEHGNFRGPSADACGRAVAREQAGGHAPPPGARELSDPDRLGRRDLSSAFVPASALRRH